MRRAAAVASEVTKEAEPITRTVFIDELPMPKRPAVAALDTDREVFARQLPADLRNEDKLREWLGADFGPVEYIFLLRDRPDGEPNGKAYIRFQRHDSAALYVEVEGGSAVAWSESERARQRSRNVYGSDVYAAFFGSDGHVLPQLISQTGVRQLWASSEVKPPRGVSSPFKARPLHFFAECHAQEFERLKVALGEALRTFHEQARHFAEAQDHLRRGDGGAPQAKRKPGPQSVSWDPATGSYVEEDLPAEVQALINNSGGQHQQQPVEAGKGASQSAGKSGEKGALMSSSKGGCLPLAKGGEPQPSKGGCQPYGKGAEKGGEPQPGKGGCQPFGKGGDKSGEPQLGKGGCQPYGKGGEKGGELPPGKGGCQLFIKGGEKGGELPPGKGGCQPFSKGGESLPSKGGCPMPGKGGDAARDKGGDPGRPRPPLPTPKGGRPGAPGSLLDCIDLSRADAKLLDLTERGEALVADGRALAQQGQVQKAVERYREGLRLLMQTVPEGVDEKSSNLSEVDRLRLQRIGDYMSAMEALSVQVPEPNVPVVPAVMGAGAGPAGEDGAGRRSRRSRWN